MDEWFSDRVDRRVFVKGVGWLSMGVVMSFMTGGCESWWKQIAERPTRRRLRTGSAAVDADIATYQAAVTAMKNLDTTNPSDPRSWKNQAAIHGVPAHFNFCEHGTDHFFDWHRAYLFYFEKICQKLTGNAKFGLPYWNWNQDLAIHSAFSSAPLFLARTRNSMSGSNDITAAALDPILIDTNFFTFMGQIEGTPHNHVHTYIGGTFGGYASANDPIFFMHHNMIDYCWAKWNIELGNDNTNDTTWTDHDNAHFVDADGNPASFKAGLTTLMPLLSYQFESSAIGSSPATAKTKAELQQIEARIRKGAPVRFEIKQRIPVLERAVFAVGKPMSMQTRATMRDFATIVDDNVRDRLFVTVDFASLPRVSDFVVRVFVNLPGASANTPLDDPHFAGSFTFFGTEPGPGADMHHHHPRFLVNLTNALQRLRRNNQLAADSPITLQLVPAPFPGEALPDNVQVTIDQLSLVVTPVIVNSSSPPR